MSIQWKFELRKLKELTPLERNPRTITEEGLMRLRKDLEFGNFKNIVVDTKLTILGGNQRYKKLLEKYGEDYEVMVSIPNKTLKSSTRKKIILLDNKQRGDYDMEIFEEEYENEARELGMDDMLTKSYANENKEVDPNNLDGTGTLIFRLPYQDYMKAKQLLANAIEKTESDTDEECLMKLLMQYE
jgi:hypothetical protein